MLARVNRLADHYVAVAVLSAVARIDRESGEAASVERLETLWNRRGTRNGHAAAARRVLERTALWPHDAGLGDLMSSGLEQVSAASFGDAESTGLGDLMSSGLEQVLPAIQSIYALGVAAEEPAETRAPQDRIDDLSRLLAQAADGWPGTPEEIADALDNALALPLLVILHAQKTERGRLALDRVPIDADTWRQLTRPLVDRFLCRLELFQTVDTACVPTAAGEYLIDKALLGATAVSYRPLLKRLDRLLSTKSTTVFLDDSRGEESHVDRYLNVIASGHQHRRFFSDICEAIVTRYAATAAQPDPLPPPRYVADMGCGDGNLLKAIYTATRPLDSDERYFTCIGADLNQAALAETGRTLANIPHRLIEASVNAPQAFCEALTAAESSLVMDDILHVRSFLDHERAFARPVDREAARRWTGLSLHGCYADRDGASIAPAEAVQSLVEHLAAWRRICGRHGLLLLEVHSLRPQTHRNLDAATNSVHFEAIHTFSGQQLIEADNFLLAAAAAGLFSDSQQLRKYPRHESYTQISLHWLHAGRYQLLPATDEDWDDVHRLEQLCWAELAADDDELRTRLGALPSGLFLLRDLETGEAVASLATQRIASPDVLHNASADSLSSLAVSHGRTLQLLSLNVAPQHQEKSLGDLIIRWALDYARLSDEIDHVVGITRCRHGAAANEHDYLQYIAGRDPSGRPLDPILRFHHDHGAQIGEPIPAFRPNDRVNWGHGIRIDYPLSDRYSAEGSSHAGVCSAIAAAAEINAEAEIRQLLGSRADFRFDPDCPLMDMGLDSLDLQELGAVLGQRCGRKLATDFFFSHPTARKIQLALQSFSPPLAAPDQPQSQPRNGSPHPPREGPDATSVGSTQNTPPADSTSEPTSPPMQATDTRDTDEPIAIIGMACRFPGNVNSVDDFWQLLREGRSGVIDVPRDRWDIDSLYDPDPDAPGKMWTRKGGFVDGIDQFDAAFFGISRREARMLDPQQRMLLETSWHAWEDAGISPDTIAGSDTGVFIGIGGTDYCRYVLTEQKAIDAYCATGTFQSTASGRLAYFYDLNGPCMSIDTACSSSMAALHLACQSLNNREGRMMLVAGVNYISPEVSINFTKARMLSPDGECRTFDARANGYVRGEGCGAIVLKRLSDALQDGDKILAVIRGTATNQDGRSNGLTAPNGAAQQQLLEQLLRTTGVSADSIGFAEAHGTGTSLGDPIEANALINALRRGPASSMPLLLGSVKTNLGHLEAASGMAAIIKVVLALRHSQIPPNRNFAAWNPGIDRSGLEVDVPVELSDFPQLGAARRVTVSSFGFGGTNAMALLEEYSSTPAVDLPSRDTHQNLSAPEVNTPAEDASHVIYLSARTAESLQQLSEDWTRFLSNANGTLAEIAAASQSNRRHFEYRRAVVGSSIDQIIDQLMNAEQATDSHSAASVAKLGFMFTGQGAQWPGMGSEIYGSNAVVRRAMDECFEHLSGKLPENLRDVMFGTACRSDLINDTLYTQPALFTLEFALAQLWQSLGIRPHICLGHSIGEYAAATIAGMLSLADALAIVARRASLIDSLPRTGSMAACFTDENGLKPLIEPYRDRVSIAALNSTTNTVISGDADSVAAVMQQLKQHGIHSQLLTVSHAFHSPLMEGIADDFETFCSQFTFHPPTLDVVSNTTATLFCEEHPLSPRYLREHLLGTVRFSDSMQAAATAGANVMLEIGPSNTLISSGKRSAGGRGILWCPSLQRSTERRSLADAQAALYRRGLNPLAESRTRHPIPHYPFSRTGYWYRPRSTDGTQTLPDSERASTSPPAPPATGYRPAVSTAWTEMRTPENEVHLTLDISVATTDVLFEHRIREKPLFPAAGYLALGMSAAEMLGDPTAPAGSHHQSAWHMTDACLLRPFLLDAGGTQTLHCSIRRLPTIGNPPRDQEEQHNNTWQIACSFRRGGDSPQQWTPCFTATLQRQEFTGSSEQTANQEIVSEITPLPAQAFYASLRNHGYDYGAAFQRLRKIAVWKGFSVGEVEIAQRSGDALQRFLDLTILIDSSAHVALALRPDDSGGALWLPVSWDAFCWEHQSADAPLMGISPTVAVTRATVTATAGDQIKCDLVSTGSSNQTYRWYGLRLDLAKSPHPSPVHAAAAAPLNAPAHETSTQSGRNGASQPSPSHDDGGAFAELLSVLQARLAYILMNDDGEEVSPDTPFAELGLDSIMATEMELEVAKLTEKPIPVDAFYELKTLREIATYITEKQHALSAESVPL